MMVLLICEKNIEVWVVVVVGCRKERKIELNDFYVEEVLLGKY